MGKAVLVGGTPQGICGTKDQNPNNNWVSREEYPVGEIFTLFVCNIGGLFNDLAQTYRSARI